jgi:hypothetical protein
MTTPNPAHSARIKCTDQLRNVSYLHYRNGWICTLANGMGAALSYAGFPHNQETACRFALDDCKTRSEVLAVAQRYGSRTYELIGEPPSLLDRLTALTKEARAAGYAVVVLYPEELIGVDNEALQIHLARAGKAFIDANREPDEEE